MAKRNKSRKRTGSPQRPTPASRVVRQPNLSASAARSGADALVDDALTVATEGVPDLPEVPADLVPESDTDSTPAADDSPTATSDDEDAGDTGAEPTPEKNPEDELRTALGLIAPMLSEVKRAHTIATGWLEAAPRSSSGTPSWPPWRKPRATTSKLGWRRRR